MTALLARRTVLLGGDGRAGRMRGQAGRLRAARGDRGSGTGTGAGAAHRAGLRGRPSPAPPGSAGPADPFRPERVGPAPLRVLRGLGAAGAPGGRRARRSGRSDAPLRPTARRRPDAGDLGSTRWIAAGRRAPNSQSSCTDTTIPMPRPSCGRPRSDRLRPRRTPGPVLLAVARLALRLRP